MTAKIVILGSCKHEPYEILAPNKLNADLYAKDHHAAYIDACAVFYPAIKEADVVVVYNPDGVIGEHTAADIQEAKRQGKRIVYLFPIKKS
jgi:hypothetical protein